MPAKKPRYRVECHKCRKEMFIGPYRFFSRKNHYCSFACRREYPKVVGQCKTCAQPIVAKNLTFNRPNRAYCSKSCRITWENRNLGRGWNDKRRAMQIDIAKERFLGKKHSVERRMATRERNLGSRSHFWKGGSTSDGKRVRSSLPYKLWREAVFTRDNFTCQMCWQRGGMLHADHIKPFAYFQHLRFDVSNGRTLCVACHRKTDTYSWKALTYSKKLGVGGD